MHKVLLIKLVLLTVILLASCNGNKNSSTTGTLTTQQNTNAPEYPTDVDEIKTITISIPSGLAGDVPGDAIQEEIQVAVIDNYLIYQGDIIVGEINSSDNISLKPQSLFRNYQYSIWPGGIVPYEISSSITASARVDIEGAVAHWNRHTGITLVQRTNQVDFVAFENPLSITCNSYVGRIGGRQVINLHEYCGFGAAVHEIGHAVGIWHEQSRPDRDSFITVNYGNIVSGFEYAFDIQSADDTYTIGAYDFDSIMHYSQYAFSVNGSPTITPNNPSINPDRLGQRYGLSPTDIAAVNQMYPFPKNNIDEWLIPLISEYLYDD